jgi:hypothetical protein
MELQMFDERQYQLLERQGQKRVVKAVNDA